MFKKLLGITLSFQPQSYYSGADPQKEEKQMYLTDFKTWRDSEDEQIPNFSSEKLRSRKLKWVSQGQPEERWELLCQHICFSFN